MKAATQLRPARPDEAGQLSDLALRSKAHWGYDSARLEGWRDELTLPPDRIAEWNTVVADRDGTVVGFATLEGEPPHGELGMLFIEPTEIGRGTGRLLYQHMLAEAGRLGFRRLTIEADPNAEGFYRAMGAVRRGDEMRGRCPLLDAWL